MVENVKELLKLHEGIKHEVYLDNENSCIVPQEVVDAMLPYFNKAAYGNPTLTHKPGWEAFEVIMNSFQKISRYMGAKILEEITFTTSETEANNLAIMGSCFAQKSRGKKIIVSEIEPVNVLQVAELMGKFGFSTTKIPVDHEGFINLEKLKEAVDNETVLVSISTVNNELGTIQPIKEAVDIVKAKNPHTLFHTDASDAYGRIPVNVQDLKVDMATVSSFKILGPRGIGALYVREGVNVEKILEGQIGTQKLWPGIENTPLIVGFTKASELAFENFEANTNKMRTLRDKLVDGVFNELTDVKFNGATISDSQFRATRWTDVALHGYRITGSTFQDCELKDVEFRDNLRGSGSERATWTNCKLRDTRFIRCSFAGAQISDVDLSDMRIDSVDFSNKVIKGNDEFRKIAQAAKSTAS